MIRQRGGTLALVLAVVPAMAAAQEVYPEDSVVKILCYHDQGTMKGTGFVWKEAGQVVTALHAVAGCGTIELSQEDIVAGQRRSTTGTLIRALREADLALIAMDHDLGLRPLEHVADLPDLGRERFYEVWGYPRGAEEIIGFDLQFGKRRRSQSDQVATLGTAFLGGELDDLFALQDYPRPETLILRVASTIQPGHSGAPILDLDGRVLAIADGGLEDGKATVNWSIPAHLYLDRLEVSDDPLPGETSHVAALYSALSPARERVFWASEPQPGAGAGQLRLVRQMTLGQVLQALEAEPGPLSPQMQDHYINEIYNLGLPDAAWESFVFEIYEDRVTGATVAIPPGMEAEWRPDQGAEGLAEATAAGGALRLQISLMEGETVEDAAWRGPERFLRHAHGFAEWDETEPAPFEVGWQQFDAAAERGRMVYSFHGSDHATGEHAALFVKAIQSGPYFLGVSAYNAVPAAEWTPEVERQWLFQQVAADFLTTWAVF